MAVRNVSAVRSSGIDPHLPTLASFVRLRSFFSVHPMLAVFHVEQWVVRKMAHNGLFVTRVALGITFLWFGLLKFLPLVAPIDVLAEKTLSILTLHLFRRRHACMCWPSSSASSGSVCC